MLPACTSGTQQKSHLIVSQELPKSDKALGSFMSTTQPHGRTTTAHRPSSECAKGQGRLEFHTLAGKWLLQSWTWVNSGPYKHAVNILSPAGNCSVEGNSATPPAGGCPGNSKQSQWQDWVKNKVVFPQEFVQQGKAGNITFLPEKPVPCKQMEKGSSIPPLMTILKANPCR